jgi:hypothetical protein
MRIWLAALLSTLIVICAWPVSSLAAQRAVPVAGTPGLSRTPPVQLPAQNQPQTRRGAGAGPTKPVPGGEPAPLPRTGADIRLVTVVGLLMLIAGLGLQLRLQAGNRRRP